MKQYLVVYMTEGGERGSVGDGSDYETYDLKRFRTDLIAKKKIVEYYGVEGVKVYKLSKRLRLKTRPDRRSA